MAINSDNLRVAPLDRDGRRQVYRDWMTRQFPKDELKSLSAIETTVRKGLYEAWGMWDGEELVAYAMLGYRNRGSLVLLDYYGVRPELRHSGYGGAFLKRLREVYAGWEAIVIESETPESIEDPEERETAVRRLGFYSRNGCTDSGLKVRLFGVEFNILVLPQTESFGDATLLRRRYEEIYRGFLSNTFFDKFVRTHFWIRT